MVRFLRNSLLLALVPLPVLAARINEIRESSFLDQLREFVTLSSPIVVNTLLGCALLGVLGGVLGSFLILRRMSLVGDALGHALLPGIAIAFIIVGSKSILPLFLGALVAGLAYSVVFGFVSRQRRVKPDAALGLTFTAFFGLGIVLLSYIQNSPTGSQSGLDKFLFGQAAALSSHDVTTIAIILGASLLLIVAFFRQLQVFSFDPGFSISIGLPTTLLHYFMMALITLAIIVSVQAVGVVLVSALLIIPGAAAFLLVKRLKAMLIVSGLIGLVSGIVGAFLSYVLPGIPTGPVVVLAASTIFGGVLLFAPGQGIVPRLLGRLRRRSRSETENLLKAAAEFVQSRPTEETWIDVDAFAAFDRRDLPLLKNLLRRLHRGGQIIYAPPTKFQLTPSGAEIGRRVLRNHLLWEVYLSEYTDIAPDHIHLDAERIEHVLTPELVARLESLLDEKTIAAADPHRSPA
jgi:manganese/zinc/iron transport system permease protein